MKTLELFNRPEPYLHSFAHCLEPNWEFTPSRSQPAAHVFARMTKADEEQTTFSQAAIHSRALYGSEPTLRVQIKDELYGQLQRYAAQFLSVIPAH